MLTSHDRVLDGVSGGADSVCLVLVLKELGFEVAVAHVNHGLRGAESDEDEAFTKQLALSLGGRCRISPLHPVVAPSACFLASVFQRARWLV